MRTAVLSRGGSSEQRLGRLHPHLPLPELLLLSSRAPLLCGMGLHDGFPAETAPGVMREGCCAGRPWLVGSGSLLSWVSEGREMNMNDVRCHEAMVGMCPCHLRPPIWPNWIIIFF